MRSRAATPGSLLAPVWVALWVLQSLLAIAHFQDHAHRYCPVHSTFEEASGARSPAAALAGEELALERWAVTPDGSPQHEACDVFAASASPRWCGTCAPAPLFLAARAEAPALPCPGSPRALSSLSVLDLAPKVSPPARA